MKRVLIYAVAVVVVCVFYKIGISSLANYLTFHPKKYPYGDWDVKSFSMPVEDHWITASDNTRLHSWYFRKKGTRTALLWLHGNGSNISGRAQEAIDLVNNLPVSVFILSYRGYGKSEGSPSEAGVYMDAMAAYKYLAKMQGVSNIIIYGKSLGGAIGIDLAFKTNPVGLIVEGSFPSLAEIGKIFYPFLPTKLMVGDMFTSIEKVGSIDCPKLFIHGDRDEVVPFEQGKKLFEKAKAHKRFYQVEGGGHSNLMEIGGEKYFQRIRNFLKECKLS